MSSSLVTTQEATDNEHLRLLKIFHYVVGGLTAAGSSFGLFHVGMGIMMILNLIPSSGGADGPPAWFGWLFTLIGAAVVLSGWTVGALTIYSGRCIQNRTKRTFSLVMAGLNCLSLPIGTALGIFTILVLSRQSVKALYQGDSRWAPPAGYDQPSFNLEDFESEEEARWKSLEEEANKSKSAGSERIKIHENQPQSFKPTDGSGS